MQPQPHHLQYEKSDFMCTDDLINSIILLLFFFCVDSITTPKWLSNARVITLFTLIQHIFLILIFS